MHARKPLDFMVRGYHGARAPTLRGQPSNDLIGLLSSSGIDDLDARAMLAMLRSEALFPAIEDHGNGMALPLPVQHKLMEKVLSRRFRIRSDLAPFPKDVIAIYNQMHRYRRGSRFDVDLNALSRNVE